MTFKDKEYIERELTLIKITTPKSLREEIIKLVGIFNTRIIDMSLDYITIEITSEEDKINTFIKMMLPPYGIKEICSTGIIALNKGLANNKTK